MQLNFEHLSFVDFERVKSVCSSWLSGSRQSKPNNKIPWMILFPEEINYCLLFNPENKEEKLYKTQHLDKHWADSLCLATSRSWLLMEIFHEVPLYIFNLLTLERIDLPKTLSYGFDSPILWIDKRSKDYLIIREDLAYFKKGDNSWKKKSRYSCQITKMAWYSKITSSMVSPKKNFVFSTFLVSSLCKFQELV
ncbi:unnamed protein product [Eruca vesicaria subsp. sativa]|uniref:KIB1-4 beta-propeller domain-containing protein n=1 Tax=Eruca vesicaria subsp. sativa TaxID=29727 RepID=A0ABC8IYN8_ERUVS|nr:unnamed protein product [Eruca vesicaria subsp. sativa]